MKSVRTAFLTLLVAILLAGCGNGKGADDGAGGAGATGDQAKRTKYAFGVVAKSQSNPVFQAARVGAEDAAKELGEKLGLEITILWRTPNEEDAQKQADFIEQLVLQGVDGITISCSDANVVTPAIDDAVEQGVAVMCFDSDAPRSRRFCFHGVDDEECGRTIMRELIEVLGPGPHVVAIPGGNQNAPNLQARIRAAQEEAAQHENVEVRGIYYHKETPQDAAARLEEVQTANPDIDGWAMIGAWALFTDALMSWEPGRVKIVGVDALPAQLPYVREGIVQKLFAQQVYAWGHRSIELLVDKVVHGKDPAQVRDISELVPVTKDNVDAFEKNWETWLR